MTTSFSLKYLFLSLFVVLLALSTARAQIYQAETSLLIQCNVSTSGTGYMGAGYVENITTKNASAVSFDVTVPTTGMYTIATRYATNRSYISTLSVYVNGRDVTQAQFPSITALSRWASQQTVVALQAGTTNTVKYRYDNDDTGGINLDYIQVTSATSAGFTSGSAAADWFPKEISVDQFTGTAHIALPLFTVADKGASVPIGLVYAATGVQVDDRGGEVGVNWSLQAGVSIRRLVRGFPDDLKQETSLENRYGWLRYPSGSADSRIASLPAASLVLPTCSVAEQAALTQIEDQLGSLRRNTAGTYSLYDTEPDIFYYSLPDHTGKFLFDAQGVARTIPYDPITITVSPGLTALGTQGVTSFTIRTADGTSYVFDQRDKVEQKTVPIVTAPKFFLRDYLNFKFSDPISYTTSWNASEITTPTGGRIQLQYELNPGAEEYPADKIARRLLQGNATTRPITEYYTEVKELSSYRLTVIKSPTATVTFRLANRTERRYSVQAIDITSPLNGNALLKRYLFEYINPRPEYTPGTLWTDENGTPLDASIPINKIYLSKVQLSNGCTTQPLFSFRYDQVTATTSHLPPPGAVNKDYWGYYTNNQASTLIPKLFVYPQLVGAQPVLPSAPYRLYEAAEHTAGGTILNGADRRPALHLSEALAGTLTEVTFAGGGKALLEYEQHRFYDPIAKQSLPAGGLRIQTIKVQDPITKVEVRRDYSYQTEEGVASGVLLHRPHFVFAIPGQGSTMAQQWTNAAVRSGEDLMPDPFEARSIGYQRVTEKLPGRGAIVTVFNTPGSADESVITSTSEVIGWERPQLGIARPTTQPCVSILPLQTGTGLYPFQVEPIYDFRRGLPDKIFYRAEPVGQAVGTLVRQQNFTYQYRSLQPTSLQPVTGVAYEFIGSASTPVYAYAKYSLLTGFQYAVRQETLTMADQPGAPSQTTVYRYNGKGWLAAKASQNSDNTYSRTRYKYLSDYTLSSTSSDPRSQAMYNRVTQPTKQISADLVEAISETVSADPARQVRFLGATIKTFATQLPSGLTYPEQVLSWQPTQALSGYDSLALESDGSLHVNPAFKLASTTLEIDRSLTVLSSRTEAGRQLQGRHLGYGGTVPVLQVAHATATEVLFCDFESDKDFSFQAFSSTGGELIPSSQAARTGKLGISLTNGDHLDGSLSTMKAPVYRLTFWAKSSSPTTLTLRFTCTGTPAIERPVVVTGAEEQWKLYEAVFDLAAISPRTNCHIQVTAMGAVQLDDVTFLPSEATTTSTTYDLAFGKSSETDGRGRTTYYEYNFAGELALVRDHNRSITRQFERSIAGLGSELSPSFSVAGSQLDGEPVTFSAYTNCGSGLQYRWDFGDGTPLTAFSSTPFVMHVFHTAGEDRSYDVRLIVSYQGRQYRGYQFVYIQKVPLIVTSCRAGVVAVDDCNYSAPTVDLSCNPSACSSPTSCTTTTFSVQVNLAGNYTYIWERADLQSPSAPAWTITQNTGPSLVLSSPAHTVYAYRCRIQGEGREGISEIFSVDHYQSNWNPADPCVPQ